MIELQGKERVVVTVTGQDRVGIVAAVSKTLADHNANIVDISQTVLQENFFAMILLVDIANASADLLDLEEALQVTGTALGVKVMVQHEDIFGFMHRI